jgi:hypothetical protein
MTEQRSCIFCPNPLDGSDEHIVPESINGRLHSKEIICHECNVKKFGANVDTILSQTFSQFIHILGLKNAKTLYVEDPEGRKYTKDKNHKVKPVKPELSIERKNGLIYVSVTGDEENALKLFEKQRKIFQTPGIKPLKLEIKRNSMGSPPMSMEIKLQIESKLILVLNKIALEYYAYNMLDRSFVNDLLTKVGRLDLSLTNVSFCNFQQDVRIFEDNEISHLILLKTDENKKILYCYIELFNIVCAVVVLKSEYTGPSINIQYRQDVISGKKLDGKVELTIDLGNLENNATTVSRENFSILIDLFCERHHDRIFYETYTKGLHEIKAKLEDEMKSGIIKEHEFVNKFVNLSAEYIGYLTVYEFPFAVADFDENQDELVNYIHSSMKESLFEEFCFLNGKLIGCRIAFTSDEHDPEKCILESFIKIPVGARKGENIVKVYSVLRDEENGELKYIPFKNLFDALWKWKEEREEK